MPAKKLRFIASALFALAVSIPLTAAETCSNSSSSPGGALPVCVAHDAVTTTGASATVNTAGYGVLRGQVWSAAGSVATVTIDARSSASSPWYTVVTVTNPGVSGEYWSLPKAFQYRINVSAYTSGTISTTLERYKF